MLESSADVAKRGGEQETANIWISEVLCKLSRILCAECLDCLYLVHKEDLVALSLERKLNC